MTHDGDSRGDANSNAVADLESGLARLRGSYEAAFEATSDEQQLRNANARLLGPNGELTALLKRMPELPKDARRAFGRQANEVKQAIEGAFGRKLDEIRARLREADLNGPPIDVTLPGRRAPVGAIHPITRTMYDLVDVFTSLGFEVAEGPEVELHEYNFDKLGFPPDHPATDMQDSFYLAGSPAAGPSRTLLRTHTSTIQVREMLRRKPPLAVIAPGAVYRRDDDVTHSPMFFQLEGFLVDRHVTFAHLKGVLTLFLQRLFGPEVLVRFRPSYFPFVEPGGEVDIGRVVPGSTDVRWMEVLGCGMIHPVVFESVGYDPEEYSGFAFGMGIDRITMLRYGISDIRLLYENDMRFLSKV